MRSAYLSHVHAHIKHARKVGIYLSASISGSEGKETQFEAIARGFLYTEVPNDPLGAKFNASIKTALDNGAEYVLIMGSDTFFAPTIWAEYAKFIKEGVDYVGVPDLYMWDWRTDECVYWGGYRGTRAGEPIGPCRLIHRKLIPEGGLLYTNWLNKNLDSSATKILPKARLFLSKPHLLTSCKGDTNITNIEAFRRSELEDSPLEPIKRLLNV